jgi:Spy/CpxP family protein refolding chaperone
MKRNLLTLAAVGAIALGGFIFAQAAPGPHGGARWHGGEGFGLEGLTHGLNLTPDQQTKVQPLIDQARPQIMAIHQDAMDKTHAVMDKTISQIRPLLTPDQQKKLDDIQKAHQEMRTAQQKLHDAMRE